MKERWLWEFSKRVVVVVALMFVIVTVFVMVEAHLGVESDVLNTLANMIADVFKWTVVSYAVKAGFENVTKIKGDRGEEEDELDYR